MIPDPITIAMIGRGLLGGIQTIMGLTKKAERPTFEVPQATRQMVGTAQSLATMGRPGREQAMQDIERSSASALNKATSVSRDPTQILNMAGRVQNVENVAKERQAGLDDDFRLQANQQLMNALGVQRQDELNQFQFNQAGRYQEDAAAKSALTGSGLFNLNQILNDLVSLEGYNTLAEAMQQSD